jgi:LacI family transcriptional regulator
VLIDRYFPNIKSNLVILDNYGGAFKAISHLLKLGYRRIGQLIISPHLHPIRERMRGYREALKQQGVRYDRQLTHEVRVAYSQVDVATALDTLTMPSLQIDALFVHNNVMAAYALKCFKAMQVRIPEDVALVSFGDRELFDVCRPPVTCVSQPTEEIGEKAVEILMEEIAQDGRMQPKQKIVLPVEFLVRQSCGALLHGIMSPDRQQVKIGTDCS